MARCHQNDFTPKCIAFCSVAFEFKIILRKTQDLIYNIDDLDRRDNGETIYSNIGAIICSYGHGHKASLRLIKSNKQR